MSGVITSKEVFNTVFGTVEEFKKWKTRHCLSGTVTNKTAAIDIMERNKHRVKCLMVDRIDVFTKSIRRDKELLESNAILDIAKSVLRDNIECYTKRVDKYTRVLEGWK